MRWQIISKLMKNQLLDLRKNPSILPIVILPPFLALIMNMLNQAPQGILLPMWINYAVVLVGIMLPGILTAEEKEKGVLDSLLVSPARYLEIIISKILVALLIIIVDVLLVLIPNVGFGGNQLIIWLAVVLSSGFFIQVGLIIGLFTSSQVAAGAFSTPAMLFFFLVPMFSNVLPKVFKIVVEYLPSLALMEIAKTGIEAGSVSSNLIDFAALIIWNGIAFYFTKLGIKHQFSGSR